jgi:hypothetical protein
MWKAQRTLPLYRQGFWTSTANLDMTYTYLGARHLAGRDEAVIALSGKARRIKDHNGELGGHAEGTAIVDLANGRLVQVDLVVHFDLDTVQQGHGIKSNGRSHIRLRHPQPSDVRS